MSRKTDTAQAKSTVTPLDPRTHLQNAGLGNMAWMEALGDFQAELVDFVAERIKQDLKTQNEILKCRTVADVQHVQAQFMQKAMDQYHAETGKLVEMTTRAFTPKGEQGKS